MTSETLRDVKSSTMDTLQRLRIGGSRTRYQSKNFMDIFAILIIQLQLNDEAPRKKINLFTKQPHPFSFLIDEAMETMRVLTLDVAQGSITTTISYSFNSDLALSLMRRFFAAKLLHDPDSRTDNSLRLEMKVQVTPKGAAMVYHACKRFGIREENFPQVVTSNFNTMNLFMYDRSDTNKLLYSEYVINILVTKMTGATPNVWTPGKNPELAENIFRREQSQVFAHPNFQVMKDFASQKNKSLEKFVSPIYHKYFSNPASDAHVQYYESESGIRVYKDKTFTTEGKDLVIRYCFPGRAIVQWLCDCTALFSVSEAIEIGRLMVNYGLIIPVTVDDSGQEFINHRDAIYTLSDTSYQMSQWSGVLSGNGGQCLSLVSSENYKELSLKSILSDPGMRCLFKLHAERECYAENVEAYVKLMEFAKLKHKVSRLWRLHKQCEDNDRQELVREAIERLTNACFSRALNLYATYFSGESRFDVNLDFELRQEVRKVMLLETPDFSEPNLSEFMTTPTCDKLWDEEVRENESVASDVNVGREERSAVGGERASVDGRVSVGGSIATAEGHLESHLESHLDLTRRLNDIYAVFARVAQSIYKLIEDDSYPRFIRSVEYTYAMEIKTHRS